MAARDPHRCGFRWRWPRSFFFFFFLLSVQVLEDPCAFSRAIHESMRLKYEPCLELLLITAKQLFSNPELYRSVQFSLQLVGPLFECHSAVVLTPLQTPHRKGDYCPI